MELQRGCLAAFVRMLASGSRGATLFERDGVLASIVPACPERSVINSVTYRDVGSLAAVLEELAGAHQRAGVRAWTVWVPEEDRETASLLEAAGHRLDAIPMAMSLELAELPEPEPDGLDWDDQATPAEVSRINDLAYGLEEGSFGAALRELPADLSLRLYRARVEGEPA